ncbi:hypothetical protein NPIL_326131 [Nephila pilipes]|uniref:Uncharacterized protein n=1 Tax=Nephila pilipes TaxID=299642 RepID=A0A8X6U533_NEPPI|nr:hypothetical protein NPIL_326131 [Nephila pilipes]
MKCTVHLLRKKNNKFPLWRWRKQEIMDGIMDSNDVVSAGKWVESLQSREDYPIILFKDQNISNEDLYPGLKAEDFLLVIMKSSQRVLV